MNKMFDTIDADRFEKLVSGIAFHKKIILLAILKLIDHNKKTTTATEIKNTYTQISKMIAENCRARITVANSIAEWIMIGIIKEVTLRKGKGASGIEIEWDIPPKEKLEWLLYQDYRLENARNVKPALFIWSHY